MGRRSLVTQAGAAPVTSNEWSFDLSERRSHSATVLSAEPVASRCSENGLNARQLISFECASTECFALSVRLSRVSQISSLQSSPTEPKSEAWWHENATSSTTLVCPLYVVVACTLWLAFVPWVMSK